MVSVQRSIEIKVPVHTLYSQLTQFEAYPQFMHDIESVEQRDDTHLHWKARMMDRPVEWDATITECVPDRCIAWQSDSGPGNAGKVELQPVGSASSRLTFTLVSEMEIEPSSPAGDIKAELSERIWENLARLRSMVESRQPATHAPERSGRSDKEFSGQETGPVAETGIAQGTGQVGSTAGRDGIDEVAKLGSIEGTAQGELGGENDALEPRQAVDSIQRDRGSPGNPVPSSGFTVQSQESSGNEGQAVRGVPGAQMDEYKRDAAGSDTGETGMKTSEVKREQPRSTQSDHSLSRGIADNAQDERDSIAEEVSFDQQSDFARHVGQLSTDDENEANDGLPNAEVIAKAIQQKRPEPEV